MFSTHNHLGLNIRKKNSSQTYKLHQFKLLEEVFDFYVCSSSRSN